LTLVVLNNHEFLVTCKINRRWKYYFVSRIRAARIVEFYIDGGSNLENEQQMEISLADSGCQNS
jgi:hypothetical protein